MHTSLGADKRGSCFALNGKLPDKSSEDAKHFFGEKKITSYLLPSSKYSGAPCGRRSAPKAIFSGRTNLYSAIHDGCSSFLFLP